MGPFDYFLQPDDDKCIYTAQLFPLLHVRHQVGMEEIFWLQAPDDDDTACNNTKMLHR